MAKLPDYAVSTGEHLAEWMEDEGINAAEMARRLGVTPKHVSELLGGVAPLSHRLAIALERVTGIPARIWSQLESGYRADLARFAEEESLKAQYERAKGFPLAYLRQHRFITAPARDHVETVRQLLRLLGVANLDAFAVTWGKGNVAYRKSAVGRDDALALATWLALAERHHERSGDRPAFTRSRLDALIPGLRSLTVSPDVGRALGEVIARLRGVGVILCVVPAVPGLGIYGATRWLHGRPVVQLSLRGKTDDQLWFTLFHELGHVLLHGDRALYLWGEDTAAEAEADAYAADLLIPPAYADRVPTTRDLAAVTELAAELGIAPSIVLGRAQRLTGDYGWGHGLRRPVEWEIGTGA